METRNITAANICMKHFEDEYKILQGKSLSSDAIPTLFLPHLGEITSTNEVDDTFSPLKPGTRTSATTVLNEVLCRACLVDTDLISVSDKHDYLQMSYSEMLAICLSIRVSFDSYTFSCYNL